MFSPFAGCHPRGYRYWEDMPRQALARGRLPRGVHREVLACIPRLPLRGGPRRARPPFPNLALFPLPSHSRSSGCPSSPFASRPAPAAPPARAHRANPRPACPARAQLRDQHREDRVEGQDGPRRRRRPGAVGRGGQGAEEARGAGRAALARAPHEGRREGRAADPGGGREGARPRFALAAAPPANHSRSSSPWPPPRTPDPSAARSHSTPSCPSTPRSSTSTTAPTAFSSSSVRARRRTSSLPLLPPVPATPRLAAQLSTRIARQGQ